MKRRGLYLEEANALSVRLIGISRTLSTVEREGLDQIFKIIERIFKIVGIDLCKHTKSADFFVRLYLLTK